MTYQNGLPFYDEKNDINYFGTERWKKQWRERERERLRSKWAEHLCVSTEITQSVYPPNYFKISNAIFSSSFRFNHMIRLQLLRKTIFGFWSKWSAFWEKGLWIKMIPIPTNRFQSHNKMGCFCTISVEVENSTEFVRCCGVCFFPFFLRKLNGKSFSDVLLYRLDYFQINRHTHTFWSQRKNINRFH